jgi:hypothetical protein
VACPDVPGAMVAGMTVSTRVTVAAPAGGFAVGGVDGLVGFGLSSQETIATASSAPAANGIRRDFAGIAGSSEEGVGRAIVPHIST